MQVFLPEKYHGQRSLAGYSSWNCIDSGMNERLTPSLSYTYIRIVYIHSMQEKNLRAQFPI